MAKRAGAGSHTGQARREGKETLIAFTRYLPVVQAQAVSSVNSVLGHVATQKMPFGEEIHQLLSFSPPGCVIQKQINTEIGFFSPRKLSMFWITYCLSLQ